MVSPKRPYVPTHSVTENYLRGMTELGKGRLQEAVRVLSDEPNDSPCHGLARGNIGLSLLRLERYQEAEAELKKALDEFEIAGCPHPPSAVQFARNLCEALVGQGRRAEALPVFNGVGNLANRLIADHPELETEIELEKAHAFNSWGSAHVQLGNYETAIDIFRVARDIYRKHQDLLPAGRAETLTNYAHALRHVGRTTEAELALQEALTIAEADGNSDQVIRVQIALAQLGSALVTAATVYQTITDAADDAIRKGRNGTAYVRLCIGAELAAERGDIDAGSRLLAKATPLEPRLDARDPNPAKLRMTKVKLLERSGASRSEIIASCIEGAHLWFARIAKPLVSGDFEALTTEMHEHFRMLARALLDAGMIEDALLSFEAGRALAHAVEVDRKIIDRVVTANPFASDGSKINIAALRSAQESLGPNELLISITVLPPDIAAFVVARDSVRVVTRPMPADDVARAKLFTEIAAIPVRLQERVGARAIPAILVDLATVLRDEIRDRVVRAVMPYSSLHDVPWRAVLRHAGVPWTKLRTGVEFGLLFRDGPVRAVLPSHSASLGHGFAGAAPNRVDLRDEAREFAAAFGPRGRCIVPSSSADLETALQSDSIVLVSCHGEVGAGPSEGRLVLYLSDGARVADDVFPKKVRAPAVILSACESGVYRMAWGDFPLGAAPSLLRAGARYCVGARFRLDARFSASFFRSLARRLATGARLEDAVAETSDEHEARGHDLWRELACVELIGGP